MSITNDNGYREVASDKRSHRQDALPSTVIAYAPRRSSSQRSRNVYRQLASKTSKKVRFSPSISRSWSQLTVPAAAIFAQEFCHKIELAKRDAAPVKRAEGWGAPSEEHGHADWQGWWSKWWNRWGKHDHEIKHHEHHHPKHHYPTPPKHHHHPSPPHHYPHKPTNTVSPYPPPSYPPPPHHPHHKHEHKPEHKPEHGWPFGGGWGWGHGWGHGGH